MDIQVEDLLDEAKTMALELRVKDRQIAHLQRELESAKKVSNEHTTQRGGSE